MAQEPHKNAIKKIGQIFGLDIDLIEKENSLDNKNADNDNNFTIITPESNCPNSKDKKLSNIIFSKNKNNNNNKNDNKENSSYGDNDNKEEGGKGSNINKNEAFSKQVNILHQVLDLDLPHLLQR